MQKNDLLRHENSVLRILDIQEDKLLVIDCLHKSIPKWISASELSAFKECTGLSPLPDYDSLDKESRRIAHTRFTMIAAILPFIGDAKQRSASIARISNEQNISKQTLRHYLWIYLVHQDIAALAPKQRTSDRQLSSDEKNMRWALNRFFYTRHKNSLTTAYTLMLKEKYCDPSGKLLPEYPSFHQFRYFYRKHRKLETYYISRDGLKHYQRNHRPLLGSIHDFAPSVGVGMLDSTVCDIYLVDNTGNLIGRPILTACVDAYSSLCCGYALSWEGGVYSLRRMLMNVIADKVEWCRQFGISIQSEDWNCSQLLGTLVTDMGAEYCSDTFEQLAELGVTIINLPAYRPELKGVVEKFFDVVQESFKKHLKGKGVIEPDYRERGAHDYRKDACLTLPDFERILLHCIIHYNCKRILNAFPFTPQMLSEAIQPHANSVWNWSLGQQAANLVSVSKDELFLTLLPRSAAKFSRSGLKVNKLRYKNEAFTERYLSGDTAVAAYDPDDVSRVWLVEGGKFIPFELIETRFKGLNPEDTQTLIAAQRHSAAAARHAELQSQIDLAAHIEAIVHSSSCSGRTNIHQIRQTRRKERLRAHITPDQGGNNS